MSNSVTKRRKIKLKLPIHFSDIIQKKFIKGLTKLISLSSNVCDFIPFVYSKLISVNSRLLKKNVLNFTIIQGIYMNLHCFGFLQLSSILFIVSSISNSIRDLCPVFCLTSEHTSFLHILFGSYFGRNDDLINSF